MCWGCNLDVTWLQQVIFFVINFAHLRRFAVVGCKTELYTLKIWVCKKFTSSLDWRAAVGGKFLTLSLCYSCLALLLIMPFPPFIDKSPSLPHFSFFSIYPAFFMVLSFTSGVAVITVFRRDLATRGKIFRLHPREPSGEKRADLHTDEKICLPGAKIFAYSTFASSGCTSIFPDWVCKSRLRPKYFLHTRFYTPRLQIA